MQPVRYETPSTIYLKVKEVQTPDLRWEKVGSSLLIIRSLLIHLLESTICLKLIPVATHSPSTSEVMGSNPYVGKVAEFY